jgi:tRNA(Ile)-lysidine synthase
MPVDLNKSQNLEQRVFCELDVLKARFNNRFILALSGGGDSMALAVLAAKWGHDRGSAIHVVSVDHKLRAHSFEDSAQAIAWAKRRGLDGEIVTLNQATGQRSLQEWARGARYGALAQAAKNFGAKVILLGHTLDDQLETIAFRLARQTGLDGLAAMRPISASPVYEPDWPCLVARPLLGLRRADLRTYLQDNAQDWLEDPSNQSLSFSRIRTRVKLAQFEGAGANSEKLATLGQHAAILRELQEAQCWQTLRSSELIFTDQSAQLNFENLQAVGTSDVERVLGWLAVTFGLKDRVPERDKLGRLRLTLLATSNAKATLSGAEFERHKGILQVKTAPPRQGAKASARPSKKLYQTRLACIAARLDEFVT